MNNLEQELIQIHQEVIRREANLSQVLRRLGGENPPIMARGLTMLGDWLIRIGTRLKDRTLTRLNPDEVSAPTYLIML
jgi:hypothetical protein